ncbi:NAD(P)-dependent oxidoreductase [Actinacidiphila yeochonensis]|uniref:NAD(P)-dependent oxidoreductase n=1 Tax=Actinacidiphila yeochonensis TaxID=89050 RepID=UPI0005609FE2|nr:NAD(P)-binding domain-containing protein [Actinacidiphila yeochonensis]
MTAGAAGAAPGQAPVTVVGLGLMGAALAGAFVTRGHPTTVWNRSPGKDGPLVERGATSAATPAEAFTAAPLAVLCVKDHEAVREILRQAGEALSGRVLVDLTTGTSEDALRTAREAEGFGARYLDGAILATPDAIGLPDTAILYSGPTALFTEHEATLAALGGSPLHLGATEGLASLYDVALLGAMWSSLNGVLHATALVGSEGVGADAFAPFAGMLFQAMGVFVTRYAEQIAAGDFTADDSTVRTHLAGVAHLVRESAVRGVDGTLPGHLRSVLTEVAARGHAEDSYASVVEYFRKPAL